MSKSFVKKNPCADLGGVEERGSKICLGPPPPIPDKIFWIRAWFLQFKIQNKFRFWVANLIVEVLQLYTYAYINVYMNGMKIYELKKLFEFLSLVM